MVSKAAEEADVLAHDGHGLGQRRAWALVFFQSVKCCAIELDLNFLGRFVFFWTLFEELGCTPNCFGLNRGRQWIGSSRPGLV